jgi:hypothetical protein
LLADGFPWSLALLAVFGHRVAKKQKMMASPLDSQTKFLLCWLILPNLFFTFAHNIIPTYPLVSLPALALLAARELAPIALNGASVRKWVYASAASLPAVMLVGLVVLGVRPALLTNTSAYVTAAYRKADPDSDQLVYVGDRIYSMEFYTGGKASHYPTIEEAVAAAKTKTDALLVLTENQGKKIPADIAPHVKLLATAAPKYEIYEVKK